MTNVTRLYWYVLLNAYRMDDGELNAYLDALELQCLARNVRAKCQDNRSIPVITKLIKQELMGA